MILALIILVLTLFGTLLLSRELKRNGHRLPFLRAFIVIGGATSLSYGGGKGSAVAVNAGIASVNSTIEMVGASFTFLVSLTLWPLIASRLLRLSSKAMEVSSANSVTAGVMFRTLRLVVAVGIVALILFWLGSMFFGIGGAMLGEAQQGTPADRYASASLRLHVG